ncbi:FecR family protein [Govanella unica]|uniref:FecR domain-containing protein n=1 Tax=Govanella unica TaxID=2975056 RepID=A0A9X3TXV1_9PROT|nr:FecR domain-containing protein [Govania unica]MDA5193677.1 FecR domain-containing protein [Govania unica]
METDAQTLRMRRKAAYWVTLLEADTPDEGDHLRFEDWLALDPRHKQAYDEIAAIWRTSRELTDLAALEVPDMAGRGGLKSFPGKLFRQGQQRRIGLGLSALAIGLTLILSSLPQSLDGARYVTKTAEVRQLTLADGSRVTLGPKSRLEVTFKADRRQLSLTGGEAYFVVAKDAARPMHLQIDGVEIRVVGTEFNIHEGPAGVTVEVVEGVVEVHVADADKAGKRDAETKIRLYAGQKIIAPSTDRFDPQDITSADYPGSWRSGRLIYENTALAEVLADMNRYSESVIMVGSPELAKRPVFASFKTDQIDQMIARLEGQLSLVADRTTPGRIILRARPSA